MNANQSYFLNILDFKHGYTITIRHVDCQNIVRLPDWLLCYTELLRCQLCHHWWQCRLSLWHQRWESWHHDNSQLSTYSSNADFHVINVESCQNKWLRILCPYRFGKFHASFCDVWCNMGDIIYNSKILNSEIDQLTNVFLKLVFHDWEYIYRLWHTQTGMSWQLWIL